MEKLLSNVSLNIKQNFHVTRKSQKQIKSRLTFQEIIKLTEQQKDIVSKYQH